MSLETKHLRIHGVVQGVGYRNWAAATANTRRLTGWVRNVKKDKSVEIVVTGDEDEVQKFISACYEGPSSARVNVIHVAEGIDLDLKDFQILETL